MLCPSALHACSLPGECAAVKAALKPHMLKEMDMHVSRQGLSLLVMCPPSLRCCSMGTDDHLLEVSAHLPQSRSAVEDCFLSAAL